MLESIAFLAALGLVIFFPGERIWLMVPLGYWLFALVLFLRKPGFDPTEKKRILWFAIPYLVANLLSGAILPLFGRAMALAILPPLFAWWWRSRLLKPQNQIAIAVLSTAPFVILWTGALRLEEPYLTLLITLLLAAPIGFFLLWLTLRPRMRLWVVVSSFGMAALFLALLIPNLYALEDGQQYAYQTPSQLSKVKLTDSSGKTFSVADLKGRIVILDFWFSGCTLCFKGFPKFQQLADQWSKEKNIVLATVNVPTVKEAETHADNLKLVEDYHFPKWLVQGGTTDSSAWNIEGYPCYFVFDKTGKLRYKGGLLHDRKYLFNNIRDIVAKLEQE
jgi:thiol-disulfide isomerase/thioredoxin